MRDRQRLELAPSEYIDAKQRERQRILADLLAHLGTSRNEPWYIEGIATARAGFGEVPYPCDCKDHGRNRVRPNDA